MRVRNLINRNGNATTNQFEIFNNGNIVFQSYSTLIAKVDDNGYLYVTKYWDYSKTTMKHLWIFLECHGWSAISNPKEMRKALKDGVVTLVDSFDI